MSLRNYRLLGFNLFWGAKLYRIKAQPNAAGRDRTQDLSVRSSMLYHYDTTPHCRIGLSAGLDIKKILNDVTKLGSICEHVVKLVRSPIPLGRNRITIKGL